MVSFVAGFERTTLGRESSVVTYRPGFISRVSFYIFLGGTYLQPVEWFLRLWLQYPQFPGSLNYSEFIVSKTWNIYLSLSMICLLQVLQWNESILPMPARLKWATLKWFWQSESFPNFIEQMLQQNSENVLSESDLLELVLFELMWWLNFSSRAIDFWQTLQKKLELKNEIIFD